MRFAAAGSADQDDVGPAGDPGVTGADRHDMGLGDHRHDVEVEAVEGLARQEPGFAQVTLDAAAVAFGDLVLGQRGEEARRRPALLVGAQGERRPALLDRGQTQVVKHQGQPGGVVGAGHAATPLCWPSNAW
jgi:hypothetical protein